MEGSSKIPPLKKPKESTCMYMYMYLALNVEMNNVAARMVTDRHTDTDTHTRQVLYLSCAGMPNVEYSMGL